MNLFDLYAKIALDTSDYDDGVKKVGKSGGDLASKLKSGLASAGKLAAKGIAAIGTAAGAAVGGLLALESSTEEYRIAMGKLNTAFEAAGYGAEVAQEAYSAFYGILGDTDTATEASQLLAQLANSEEDVSTWTNIAAGVFGTFGDSLPIEGLIEASNETAKVGKVTGVLADALNWVGISEDVFNQRLEECSSESERNRLIILTLSGAYDEASEAFYRNNEELVRSRENQAKLDATLAKLGETVSTVKNALLSEFLPSISSVVSAFNDLLNGVEGADEALSEAIQSLVSAAVEKLPEFLSFGVSIIKSILEGILNNLPEILGGLVEVVKEIGTALIELAPSLLEAGEELLTYIANGIETGLPNLISKLPEIISSVTGYITENLPAFLESGIEIINSLVNGLISAIPALLEAWPEIFTALIGFFTENYPKIVAVGFDIISNLIAGLINAIPSIIKQLPRIVEAIISGFSKLPEMMVEVGKAIIQGLIEGMLSLLLSVGKVISDIVDTIFGTAQKEADIHSPSKRAAWIGQMIDQGFANGIADNVNKVEDAVKKLNMVGSLESGISLETVNVASSGLTASGGSTTDGLLSTGFQSAGDIVINLTADLDGAVLSQKMYRYNLEEQALQGTSLVEG